MGGETTVFGSPAVSRNIVLLTSSLCALIGISFSPGLLTAQDQEPFDQLTIVVPAVEGGGWDLTARDVKKTLEEEGLAQNIQIIRSPGAGGLIGLAQFVAGRRGDGSALLISGMFTVGAETPNRAIVSLIDATPIARLTETGAVIVVPSISTIQSIEELIVMFESNPDRLVWSGGSLGGPDQMVLRGLADALGVDPGRIHYQAYPGGTDVGASLVAGHANVGISDFSELEALIDAGHLRALALSSEHRLPDVPIPTLKEVGIDITLGNWRGIFAPPGISASQKQRLVAMFDRLSASPVWQRALAQHYWSDAYLSGDHFESFVRSQYNLARVLPELRALPTDINRSYIFRVIWRRYAWLVILLAFVLTLAGIALWQRTGTQRKVADLAATVEIMSGDAEAQSVKLLEALQGRMQNIQDDFEKWGLSTAEQEIALLLLKGLRLQEIADIRNTSERTVRQQASSIYRKGRLESRTDLSAYFIEDLMNPMVDASQTGD